MRTGGLIIGKNNTLYLALNFAGQLTFDATTLTSITASTQTPDGLLFSLNDAGAVNWTRQLPGSLGPVVTAIGTDAAGNLLAAGHFDTQISLGPTASFSGKGGHLFAAKYSAAGQLQWAQRMGGEQNDAINALTTDGNGDVAFCGYFGNNGTGGGRETATFGPVTLTTTGNGGNPDGFVAKYSAQGIYLWVRAFASEATETAKAIVASKTGDFYVSGIAGLGTTFGPLATTTGNGSPDGFVAKYSAAGAEQWVTAFGGPYADYYAGNALAIDSQGLLYVGGSFVTSATFGSLNAAGVNQVYTPFIAQLRDNQVLGTRPNAASQLALEVYPNPSTGPVQVNWPAGLQPTRLQVLDVLGRVLRSSSILPAATGQPLNLAGLAPGIYFVQLQTAAQGQLTRRLLLK